MIETVVAVEDIKKLYGEDFELHKRIDEGRAEKAGYGLMDEYLAITIIKKTGPFASVSIQGQPEKRFIIPHDIITSKELPDAMDIYGPILTKYFDTKWWFDNRTNYLYLYYPELEITNSMGLRHTMHDLVVRLACAPSNGALQFLYGKRYSFTQQELEAGYVHSHLQSFSGVDDDGEESELKFTDFCTGGESPFNKLMKDMNKRNSSKQFEMFIVQLEQYLKWESLEGRPHISIVDIGAGGNSSQSWHTSRTLSNLRVKVCKFILEELSKYSTIPVLTVSYGINIIDPSLDTNWFFQNIELPVAEKFKDEFELIDWDDRRQTYIVGSNNGSETNSLWDYEGQEKIVEKLGIVPRIIEVETPVTVKLVKRLSTSVIQEIVQELNNYLFKGTLKSS